MSFKFVSELFLTLLLPYNSGLVEKTLIKTGVSFTPIGMVVCMSRIPPNDAFFGQLAISVSPFTLITSLHTFLADGMCLWITEPGKKI